MKKLEIVDSFGDTIVVEPELQLYTLYDYMGNKMPGLAIEFYSYDEDGEREPYATLTTNFSEFISAKDCAYIDTNNNSFAAQLLEMGICQDTGFTKQSGYCTYPLWKFDKDFLKEIDVHRLYDTYEKKFDKYMEKGAELPIRYREVEIITNVVEALGIECKIDPDSDGLVVWANDNVYYRGEFCRYLLAEVCEYDENGAVKGLPLDLCNDFYDVCEYNEVCFSDYNKVAPVGDMEYVITMSSGGGTVRDFLTCASREEAEELCENYDWVFMDENEFAWSLDIDEREISLDARQNDAVEGVREMKYTNYGKQLMQPWCDLARQDLDSDTFDGTSKYQDKIRSAEDAAGWCLLTYDVSAIDTVNEWIEIDHTTEAWGIDVREIIAVLEKCLTEELQVSFETRLNYATERSEKTNNSNTVKDDVVKE